MPETTIPRLDLRGQHLSPRELKAALPRAEFDIEAALDAVRPIVADVAERGAPALYDAAERFDGIRPPSLRVPDGAPSWSTTSRNRCPESGSGTLESTPWAGLRRQHHTTAVSPWSTSTWWGRAARSGLILIGVVPSSSSSGSSLSAKSPSP